MGSNEDKIDKNTEIKLLLNYSLNDVSNLRNVSRILDGKYEDVINELFVALTEMMSDDESLEEIVRRSISESSTHPSWLCVGIASLLYFTQCNWTGPHVNGNINQLRSWRDEAFKSLSLHDECNVNVQGPELLYLSKKIFLNADLQLKYKSCIWWLFRANLLHQHILEERSGMLFAETEDIILKIGELNILKDPLCELLFNLEVIRFYLDYRRTQNSEAHLERALSLAGLMLDLKGAMGKRTKYQQVEKAQLYLKVTISKDVFPSIDCKSVPKSVDLNDELRLERIEFSEREEEEIQLGALEEAIILAKYTQLQLCQPKHKLTDEEVRPYLTKIIDNTRNWSLKMTSLYYRCLLECDHKRTIMRSLTQAQSLLKEYNDKEAPVARRMDLLFTSGMRPIWILEEKLAHIMLQHGLVKGALEIYMKIGLWEEVIACYCILRLNNKAAEVIRQELSKKPTVKLWCLLGDATGDVNHYETAWKLSKERSSRAQRHWGYFYFEKKNYVEAVPHLKMSVELNNIQEYVWLRLGYAALQTEDWKLAAMAYRRYCAFEPYSFEAWNNLAKAYIKLGDKSRAWKSLQDAVKCDYDRWEVWDNLMIVSIDLGHFSQVIRCYHRILDLKSRHLDTQVLRILTDAITNDINDADGNPVSCLLQKCLELFGRLASIHSSSTLRMYAQLVALKKTNVDDEKATQYLQQAYRAATSDPNWSHREDKTLDVLELCCDLVQACLRCTANTVDKRRKMLGSAKLTLQGVVKAVEKQEWSSSSIIEQLMKVKECLTTVINDLDQIKPT